MEKEAVLAMLQGYARASEFAEILANPDIQERFERPWRRIHS